MSEKYIKKTKKRKPFKQKKEIIMMRGLVNELKVKITVRKIRKRGKH